MDIIELLKFPIVHVHNCHLAHLVRRLKKHTKQARKLQSQLLDELLERNGSSGFGRDHGLAGVRGYKELVGVLGVTDYETYRPYVERVAEGEASALLGKREKLRMFALTSGTTGKPKQIPVTDTFLRGYHRGWRYWLSCLYDDHRELWHRQVFQISGPPDDYVTGGGVPCGAISGLTSRMQNRLARSHYAGPLDVCYISDTASRYYSTMRLAVESDVGLVITASPAMLNAMARCVQERTEEFLRDIHDGTLWQECVMDEELRARLTRKLKPNPGLAGALAKKIGGDGVLPRHLWEVAVVGCWLGGTMGLNIPQLRQFYGEAAVRDIGLMASEGHMSIPLADGSGGGVLDIESNFFEFIPAEELENWSGPGLLCDELQVGQKYFIILTTPSGLFRYNIFDVVEVTGYMNGAPIIRFLNKGDRISSVVGEKLSEHNVVEALSKVCRSLGGQENCTELVLCPQWGDPPFYRLNVDGDVFSSLAGNAGSKDDLAMALDKGLAGVNIEYESKRKSHRLGPVQVRLLSAGYMAKYDAEIMARSVTARSQFKHRYLHTELDADKDFPVWTGPAVQRSQP